MAGFSIGWQGSWVGIALLALAGAARPGAAQETDVQSLLDEAHGVLVEELESYVAWCTENGLFRSRARALEEILTVAPDHADARRILGYRQEGDEWIAPDRPKVFHDRNEEAKAESEERFERALGFFVDFVVLLLDDPAIGPEARDVLEREALRVGPDDPRIHAMRGEVRLDQAWALKESAAAQRRRAELRDLVAALAAAPAEPEPASPMPRELAFGLDFEIAEAPGLRVLTTGEHEEAVHVLAAMESARRLFDVVFDAEAFFPNGCTVFVLTRPEEKAAFLERHPALTKGERERLARLDGSGVEGTADWAFWEGDAEKRLDGVVRMTFDWFFRKCLDVSPDQGWIHEGFGLYLTWLLVGTRQNWFVGSTGNVDPKSAFGIRNQLLDPDVSWMEAAFDAMQGVRPGDLSALFSRRADELGVQDLLCSYALAAFFLEAWPDEVPPLLARISAGVPAEEAIRERLGTDLEATRRRFVQWLDERRTMPDVVVLRYTDEELASAWGALAPAEKREVVARFAGRLSRLATSQLGLVRRLLASEPGGRGRWRSATEPTCYDPVEHAPALPIPRTRLSPDDARVRELRAEIFPTPDPKRPISSWRYDWASGEIVRTGDPDDPEKVFANALEGVAPDVDLARALALRMLDGGHQRKVLAALAHAYTDRAGNVFPGVTLYDVWASGTVIEMPDVDALGIVHDVLGDYETWVSPVPGEEQPALYATIERMFKDARRYREIREILAGALLLDRPLEPTGFGSSLVNLHALWSDVQSDVGELASQLPEEADWHPFFRQWVERCRRDPRVWTDGWRRQIQLRRDRRAVRDELIAVLEESGRLAPRPAAPGGAR